MAYIDVVGDVIRATQAFVFTNGQVQETTLHFLCTATSGTDTRSGVCTTLDTWWGLDLKPFLASPQKLYGTQVHLVKSAQPYAPVNTIANVFGTGSSVTLPTVSRPIVKWTTALSGPHYRGRSYLATFCEGSSTAAGDINATANTAINTWAARISGGIFLSGSFWTPVIYHRVPIAPIGVSTTVIAVGASSGKYGNQHRGGAYGKVNPAPW